MHRYIFPPAKLPSVHFQSGNVAVTEGHRTVLCVVLDGVPAGGMSEDLTVTFTLTNSTAGMSHVSRKIICIHG